jgi:hypothetical protein
MDLFLIKIFALVTMAVDHLGVFIFPNNYYLRLIGRLSFPLFAWAIANGAYYTKNIYKYLIRLLVLAVISQIPYALLFKVVGVSEPGLNVLFTFSLGLLAIILVSKTKNIIFRVLIIALASLLAFILKTDYQIFGVFSVITFYLLFNKPFETSIVYSLLLIIFYLLPLFANRLLGGIFEVSYLNIFELFSVLSLFIIAAYNKKKGSYMKFLFYVFYPLHILILYFVKVIIIK